MRSLKYFSGFIGLFTLVLLTACKGGGGNREKPINLIPEDEFVSLLVDLSLCESAANINIKQVTNLKMDSVYAFNPLKERMIRKSQYDSTLAYYSEHIPEYKAIYELVLERISALQAQASGTMVVKN